MLRSRGLLCADLCGARVLCAGVCGALVLCSGSGLLLRPGVRQRLRPSALRIRRVVQAGVQPLLPPQELLRSPVVLCSGVLRPGLCGPGLLCSGLCSPGLLRSGLCGPGLLCSGLCGPDLLRPELCRSRLLQLVFEVTAVHPSPRVN